MGARLTATQPGCLLIYHGTRSASGAVEGRRFRDEMAAARPAVPVVAGYLELLEPDLDDAVDRLVSQEADQIVAVPLLLAGARHTTADVPAALRRGADRHPAVPFGATGPLGTHPAALQVLVDRVAGAQGGLPADAVVLAGRGSSEPDAAVELGALADRLSAGLPGLTPVVPASVAGTGPDLATALTRCRQLGARRIVVAPFLLFHGAVVDQVAAEVGRWAQAHPETTVVTAGHLGPDPRLVDAGWALFDAGRR